MPYLGNNLGVAFSSYKLIDSLTASFNGTTTSFALTVNGVTPVPFPLNEQNILISVGGVPQKPDSTGTEGFRFSGSNIVFSSAPKTGEAFWGVVLAGADRVNAGVQYPDGTASVPSISFASQTTTGFYRSGSGQIGVGINGSTPVAFSTSGVQLNGSTSGSVIIASPAVAGNNTLTLPTSNGSANQFLKNGATAGSLGYSSMVEDSSGRLLVGTSSSSANATLVLNGSSGGAGNPGIAYLQRNEATPGSGSALGQIFFANNAGNTGALISSERDGGTWTSGSSHPGRLAFSTTPDSGSSPVERLRITSGGMLNVGTATAPSAGPGHEIRWQGGNRFNLKNTDTAGGNLYGLLIEYSNATANNNTNEFIYCQELAALRFQVRSNGGIANYQANNVNLSDINTKKDITPAADTWDCIKGWEIVNYRYKEQPDDADLNLGVIAQQVAESCPEVITIFQQAKEATEDKPAQEKRLGVKEQQMYWMAIKALQEAQVRIEQLEAKVAALEGV